MSRSSGAPRPRRRSAHLTVAVELRSSTGPRHVRILAGRLGPGTGSHHYNRELARRLAARGHRVSVVCLERTHELPADVVQHEIAPRGYADRRLIWRLASWLEWRHADRGCRQLPLDEPDVAPEGLLNQAIWHSVKGPDVPYPAFRRNMR